MNDLFMNRGNWTPELNPLQSLNFGPNNEMFNKVQSLGFKAKSKLPHVLLNIGQSGSGEDYTSSFNKKPSSKTLETFLLPTKLMSDNFLAADFKFGLKNGISGGAFFSGDVISNANGRKYAELFVDHLMTGNGKTWFDDGVLSAGMKQTPEVQSFTNNVKTEFKNLMQNKFGNFWEVRLNRNNYSNISFSFGSSPTLKGLVGGTQKTIVTVQYIIYNPFYRTWAAILVLRIEDDFGVSESDVTNPRGASAAVAVPALADFWVLQHQRGKKPFTTVFKIPFFCQGNY